MDTSCFNLIRIKNDVSSNLAEVLFILCAISAYIVQSIIGLCRGSGDLRPQEGIVAYYSIGDVAERCGINPVTLRAWQRRYGLLKSRRSEDRCQLFDEEDIQRIEETKRWINNGVPVDKVKALLETASRDMQDDWSRLQEEMMSILRMANPAELYAQIISLGREHPVDQLINHIYLPVRQRLVFDHNISHITSNVFDGALIEYAAALLFEMHRRPGKEAILMAWNVEERARSWLEAWRLLLLGWYISVLADPIESPCPELFPTQTLIVWVGMALTRGQNELLRRRGKQGHKVILHVS